MTEAWQLNSAALTLSMEAGLLTLKRGSAWISAPQLTAGHLANEGGVEGCDKRRYEPNTHSTNFKMFGTHHFLRANDGIKPASLTQLDVSRCVFLLLSYC